MKSSSDPDDLNVRAAQLVRDADEVRQSAQEWTRGLVRASAEYFGSERRSSHSSHADRDAVVTAVKQDLRRARNTHSLGEELAGIERRKHA